MKKPKKHSICLLAMPLILFLKESQEVASKNNQLKKRALHFLREFQCNARKLALGMVSIEKADILLTCAIDELCNRNNNEKLLRDRHDLGLGGITFFDILEREMSAIKPNNELFILAHLLIEIGFSGKYANKDPKSFKKERASIQEHILKKIKPSEIFPMKKTLKKYSALLCSFIFIGNYIGYNHSLEQHFNKIKYNVINTNKRAESERL